MARFQYFDHWTDEQRKECFERAKIQTFEPEQTVLVEGQVPVNYVHFVLSGRCMVLQCLKLMKIPSKYGTWTYKLAEPRPIHDEITRFHCRRNSRLAELKQSTFLEQGNHQPQSLLLTADNTGPQASFLPEQSPNYEYHFVDIATYACGSVFGVGEHMDDRAVVARSRVQCLLIPRYWLLQKRQNMNNVWNRVGIFLEQRQLSREKLFQWYLNDLRWRKYRSQLRENVLSVHVVPTHPTRENDAPLLCRIEESNLYA